MDNRSSVSIPSSSRDGISTSWENALDLMEYLNTVIDPGVLVDFSIKRLAPALPSRNQENVRVARLLGVSVNTVDNWRNEGTKCSMPLKLAIAVGKTLSGPVELIKAFSKFDGHDHTQYFEWCA